MALHSELPLYRDTFQLLKLVVVLVRNIPRDFKRTVGDELLRECAKITTLIYRANVSTRKVRHIQAIRESVQVVELLLRLSIDMRWATVKQSAPLVLLTEKIGRQATAWKKSSSNSPAG